MIGLVWQIICGILIGGTALYSIVWFLSQIKWYFDLNAGLILKIPLLLCALGAIIFQGFLTYGILTGIFWDYGASGLSFRFWPLFLLPLIAPIGFYFANLPGLVFFLGIPLIWQSWNTNLFVKLIVCLLILVLLYGLQFALASWVITWPILK